MLIDSDYTNLPPKKKKMKIKRNFLIINKWIKMSVLCLCRYVLWESVRRTTRKRTGDARPLDAGKEQHGVHSITIRGISNIHYSTSYSSSSYSSSLHLFQIVIVFEMDFSLPAVSVIYHYYYFYHLNVIDY